MAYSLRDASVLALSFLIVSMASGSSELACQSSDCVTIDPSTYDRHCAKDSDCTYIDVGQLCSGGCNCGQSAAINVAGFSRYQAATAGISSNGCECGFPGTPTCISGLCELCGSPAQCPGLDSAADAGTCEHGATDASCE
jgi:hypothetical protein